jgi:hypothetical protein
MKKGKERNIVLVDSPSRSEGPSRRNRRARVKKAEFNPLQQFEQIFVSED